MSYISGQSTDGLTKYLQKLWPDHKKFGIEKFHVEFYESGYECSNCDKPIHINSKLTVEFLGEKDTFHPKGKRVAVVYLEEQPACCGLAVTTYTQVDAEYQGKGIGRKLVQIKEDLALHMGYSALQATISWQYGKKAPAEIHLLKSSGWEIDFSFVNRRTMNVITAFHKVLWTRQNEITNQGTLKPKYNWDTSFVSNAAQKDCRCTLCLSDKGLPPETGPRENQGPSIDGEGTLSV